MKEIIEYFDRSFVINLIDRVDRRRQVEREFKRIGLRIPNDKVEIFSAVRPTERGGFVDISTKGCFSSHRDVLELARHKRLRNVLVFEDDVAFRRVGVSYQKRLLRQLSGENWDLLFFGFSPQLSAQPTKPLIRWDGEIRGTHCYAVNGPFLDTMIEYMDACERRPRDHPDGGPMPADGVYNHVRRVYTDTTLSGACSDPGVTKKFAVGHHATPDCG